MLVIVFFFEHKTAYEMRISDGSSDVCSSDLVEVTGSYRSSGGPFPVTTADVDGDGTVDVVMAASTGQVRVYNGVGDGTIEATPTLLPITGVTSQIVASDLDGDGDEDLVTAQYAAHTVPIVENLAAQIGRASCRERVGQYVSFSVLSEDLNTKKN